MGANAILVLVLIGVVSLMFVTEVMPIAFTALLIPLVLQLSGVLTASQAWAGFTNSMVLSLVSLFMLGKMLTKSSFIYHVKLFAIKDSRRGSPVRVYCLLMLVVTGLATLMSVTAAIAVFAPILGEISDALSLNRRRVIKDACDLGAFATTNCLPIGTSLSLILLANTFIENGGGSQRFGLMDFTYIELPMLAILLGWMLLRNRNMFRGSRLSQDDYTRLLEEAKNQPKTQFTPIQDFLAQFFFFANLILMIVGQSLFGIPIYVVSIGFVLLSILLRLITEKEAFSSVSWSSVFLIGGTLALSSAITASGLDQSLAAAFSTLFSGTHGGIWQAVFFCALSCLMTQFVSNTAVMMILCPVAVGVAVNSGLDPRIFISSIYVGSNSPFATPMATTSEAFVYGYCGYRMKEFVKEGWFQCVLMTAAFALVAPLAFHFLIH